MQPETTIRRALTDEHLLGSSLAGDSWQAWRTLLIAAMGEELTPGERTLFTQLTGRATEPLTRVEELVAVVGRRGGKSRALARRLPAACRARRGQAQPAPERGTHGGTGSLYWS